MSTLSPLLQTYFDKHHSIHVAEIMRRTTVQGRMEEALEKSDGSAADGFYRFFKSEVNKIGASSGRCLILMPEFGVIRDWKKKITGKIIIEIDSDDCSTNLTKDFFELQLSHTTCFANVKLAEIKTPAVYPSPASFDDVFRYYNMFVHRDEANSVVQRVLFCSLFKQRFLMTTASRVMGSITTQRLTSCFGQVFSFRECALKE